MSDTEPAMFVLYDIPGLLVNPDDHDNPNNHVVLTSDAGTKVSFSVANVGGEGGTCKVGLEVNNQWVQEWESSWLEPGESEATEVRGMGRYPEGWYEFLAYINPGAGHHDHLTNNVNIVDP